MWPAITFRGRLARARTVQAGQLRIFGLPADLSNDGRIVGGPAGQLPDRWLWAAYAAPTPALRSAALGLVDENVIATWSVDSPIPAHRSSAYLGVRTRVGISLSPATITGPTWPLLRHSHTVNDRAALCISTTVRASDWLRSGGPIAMGAATVRPSRPSRPSRAAGLDLGV